MTHPTNFARYNRLAGSDFYGMWLEIKEHPDGPSATNSICPQGLPIGNFDSNVAHSNVRFGMRFFVLVPRENPCLPIKTETDEDIWAANPSIQ